MVCESKTVISAPVEIGGKKYRLSWHVVEAPIPLLWGKESMKRAEVLLDLSNDRARIKGPWVDLIISNCDYYGVSMLPKRETMETSEGLVEKGKTRKTSRKDLTRKKDQNIHQHQML